MRRGLTRRQRRPLKSQLSEGIQRGLSTVMISVAHDDECHPTISSMHQLNGCHLSMSRGVRSALHGDATSQVKDHTGQFTEGRGDSGAGVGVHVSFIRCANKHRERTDSTDQRGTACHAQLKYR